MKHNLLDGAMLVLLGGLAIVGLTRTSAIADDATTKPSSIFDYGQTPNTGTQPSPTPPDGAPTTLPAVPAPEEPAPGSPSNVVDLIQLADIATGEVSGKWKFRDGGLFVGNKQLAKFQFLYEPPAEYDYRVTFVPKGRKTIALVCWANGHQFSLTIGGGQNTFCEIDDVQGAATNPTRVVRPSWLSDGQTYTAVVSVRAEGVRCYLDGNLITQLKTDYTDLSILHLHAMKLDDCLGLLTNDTTTTFSKIEVVEIKGKGKQLNPAESKAGR